MARHPGGRRVHGETDSPDDAFVARVLELSAWARQNSRALAIGGIVAVLGVLAIVYYFNRQQAIHATAATELAEIRQTIASGNAQLAIRDLRGFLDLYGEIPAGRQARVLLGELYLQQNQPERAIATLEPLAGSWDERFAVDAALLLAAAYEAAEQPQQAVATYLAVAEHADFEYRRRIALSDAARVRQQQGNAAGAAELYQRLVEMTSGQEARQNVFEMRLAEARALARTGAET